MIRLEHVSKTFDTVSGDVHAVKEVNLEIQDGEILASLVSAVPVNRPWYVVSICWNALATAKFGLTTRN